jgi:hypothetical protein
MKKIAIALLLYIALSAAIFAQNESDFIFDGKGTITGYKGRETKLVIPSHIGGVSVTAIDEKAFAAKGLTSVIIPSGVYVGWGTFANNKLTSLIVGDEVFIRDFAFENNQLTSFTMGNGCSIADSSFRGNNIKNFVLGSDVYFTQNAFNPFVYYDYMCNGKRPGT